MISDKSYTIPRDVKRQHFLLQMWSPQHKYENKIKTENSKLITPENVHDMVKVVKLQM